MKKKKQRIPTFKDTRWNIYRWDDGGQHLLQNNPEIKEESKERVRHTWNETGHELIAAEDGGWGDGDSLFSLFLCMLERSHDPNMLKNWR